MYDELVKRLRNRRICIQQSGSLDDFPMLREAADAIEQLTADLARSKEWEGFWKEQAEEAKGKLQQYALAVVNKPRWIPVTGRLPEYMENVLVTDGVFSGMGWRDYYDCHGTKPREDCWVSPNTNVNDLGITHWMPLPEPPKEE